MLMLFGCGTKIEYKTIEVPTIIAIDRPDRPQLTKEDTVPSYIAKLLGYIEKLEVLIDEHNKGANK